MAYRSRIFAVTLAGTPDNRTNNPACHDFRIVLSMSRTSSATTTRRAFNFEGRAKIGTVYLALRLEGNGHTSWFQSSLSDNPAVSVEKIEAQFVASMQAVARFTDVTTLVISLGESGKD